MFVAEEEFSHLKSQLNLCIEYNHFHEHLIEMLNLCIRCQKDDNPEYIIYFEVDGADAQFSIVQKTQFRQLTHLPLYFKSGNDVQQKEYLAGEIKLLKEQNAQLKYELEYEKETSSRTIRNLEDNLKDTSQKYDSIQRESSQQVSEIKLHHSNEISELKEKHLHAIQELQSRLEREKKNSEENLLQDVKSLTLKNDELSSSNTFLSSEKFKLESRVRELENKLETLKNEYASCMQELVTLRGQNKDLDTIKFTNEKNLSKNQMELIALKQQLKDKDIHLENIQKLHETTVEQKNMLSTEVETMKEAIKSTSDRYKQAVNEIRKGNEIISRLQMQMKQEKSNSKRKKLLMQQFEAKIKQLEQDKIHMEHEISTLKTAENALKNDIENLKTQLEGKQQEVKTHLDQMKRLQMVNDSLSHKLNDSHSRMSTLNTTAYKRNTSFAPGTSSFIGSNYSRFTPQTGMTMNNISTTNTSIAQPNVPSVEQPSQYVYQSSAMREQPPIPTSRSGFQKIMPTIPSSNSYTDISNYNVNGIESSKNTSPQKPNYTSTIDQPSQQGPQTSQPMTSFSSYIPNKSAAPSFVSFNPATLNTSKFHE